MIRVTHSIWLDEKAIAESFVRASGPGGQNVNKVSTAVLLRVSLDKANLPPPVRARLEKLAGRRLTLDGELLIASQRHRTQERNRVEAMGSLIALIQKAAIAPIRRVATKPSFGARQRRMDEKTHRSRTKSARGGPAEHD